VTAVVKNSALGLVNTEGTFMQAKGKSFRFPSAQLQQQRAASGHHNGLIGQRRAKSTAVEGLP